MPRPTTPQPPIPDWSESDYLVLNDFDRIASRRIELKMLQDSIDKELKDLNLELGAMLATADVKSVRFGFHRLTLGSRTTGGVISRGRLLEVGVSAEQIDQATSPKMPGNNYVTVTAIESMSDQED